MYIYVRVCSFILVASNVPILVHCRNLVETCEIGLLLQFSSLVSSVLESFDPLFFFNLEVGTSNKSRHSKAMLIGYLL